MSDNSISSWLIRLPEIFTGMESDILSELQAVKTKSLGRDFLLVRSSDPARLRESAAAKFLRWNLPVQHSWPCHPQQTPGFIEKAAQALWNKFGPLSPQTMLAGPLDPDAANSYYRKLASNLRGRALQLFPAQATIHDAESQDPAAPTLFCLVGREGLFAGMHPPRAANGFHPGGTRFIRQSAADAISRAGAKLAEALHHLRLHRPPPPAGAHWLELGASPGGMTAELLARGYQVTAVDRAPLDARLAGAADLHAVCMDAARFTPPRGMLYDAILCDMNGDPRDALAMVIHHAGHLRRGGYAVFTLKLAGAVSYQEIIGLCDEVAHRADAAGLRRLALTHLTYNRHEFTLLLERAE
jgi:23S rRNA C2498 (ribose-2'-O)-methylase RlmM